MYKSIYFDISGKCNAKCPWCITGNRSIKMNTSADFVEVETFVKVIERLITFDFISSDTVLNLYNWGEPLLHPNLVQLLKVLNENNIQFAISTNASKVVKIENNLLNNLSSLTISMPGFSQASYDRIHGFNFKKILSNIDELLRNFKNAGFKGRPLIAYHIYQFNIEEIAEAMDFCFKRKILFSPVVAYINDYNLAKSYLMKTASYEDLYKMTKDLLLFYVDELIEKMPNNFKCPQFEYLVIDSRCNVLTCCAVPQNHPDYSIGSLLDLSKDEIFHQKRNQNICIECISSGLSFWGHNPYKPEIKLQRKSWIGNSFLKIKRRIPFSQN